jgi:photosystem II stability/assembly factor-like uncharacterized protein
MRAVFVVVLLLAASIVCYETAAAAPPPSTSAWQPMWAGEAAYSRISFPDDTTGWALGPRNQVGVTHDGGATWTVVVPADDGFDSYPGDISATSPDSVWVSGCRRYNYSDKNVAYVRHTHDGGQTWDEASLPPVPGYSGRLMMVDDLHGWWKTSAVLYSTIDGGHSWQPVTTPDTVYTFFALDAEHVWIITGWARYGGGDDVYASTDGGDTWTQAVMATQWDGYGDLSFSDPLHGFELGKYGSILRTADGGLTWARAGDLGEGGAICAVDSARAWVCCGVGAVFATDDGGKTWLRQRDSHGGTLIGCDIEIRGDRGWAASYESSRTSHTGFTDLRPPVTTCEAPGFISTSVTAHLSATDGETGVAEIWSRVDNGPWQEGTEVAVDVPADVMTGTRTIRYTSVDTYGNWETVKTRTIVIDKTPPLIVFDPDWPEEMDGWTRSDSHITLYGADDWQTGVGGCQVWLSRDGGEYVSVPNGHVEVTRALADHSNDGLHTLTAYAVDALGNACASVTHSVSIDTRRPTAWAPVCYARSGGSGTFKCRIKDAQPCAGLGRQLTIKIKTLRGRILAVLSVDAEFPTGPLLYLKFRCPLKAGKYRYTVAATDKAGNRTIRAAINYLIVRPRQ